MTNKKSVVVTGASTGIGWGISKVLLARNFQVYGTVRKPVDAARLQTEFGSDFFPLLLDVTDESAVRSAAEQVKEGLGQATLAGLVNNAGIAVAGPLLHLPVAEYRHQLEVNLVAPLLVTQVFAPLLGTDRTRQGQPGRIVNISSVAGKVGLPFLGAYAASKHGLEGMSESLRRELLMYGIEVIVIGPGSVVTPIWDKAESADTAAYQETEYAPILEHFRKYFIAEGRKGLPPEAIGQAVHIALTTARPKVRYAVVPQRLVNWTLPMLLPKRVLDKIIGKQLSLAGGNVSAGRRVGVRA
jgi:NAD(P)-dependent dehydrogenase (short-subunit alcohol dehydrogenase family)